MKIKSEKGITMLMLVITVTVMLIIATVLITFTVGDGSLLQNAKNAKFKEKAEAAQSQINEKIINKQEVLGTDDPTKTAISQDEINEILTDNGFDENEIYLDDENNLKYDSSKFTSAERKILEEIGITN